MRILQVITLLIISIFYQATANDLEKASSALKAEDYTLAHSLLLPLAKDGDLTAQFGMGLIYYNGLGVTSNHQEALKWYTLSAEQGHSVAQLRVGDMLIAGEGTEKNVPKASEWYLKSARLGNPTAQYKLAEQLSYNLADNDDLMQGYFWLLLSSHGGFEEALQTIESYERLIAANSLFDPTSTFASYKEAAERCYKSGLKSCPAWVSK